MAKRLETMLSLYVKITTGILFVTALYITVFYGWELELKVDILWQILGLSFACALGSLVMPEERERELSGKSMLACILLYYVYVNLVVLFSGFRFGWFSFDSLKQVLGMVAAIAFVYIGVMLLSFWKEYREAERINRKLEGRKAVK